MLGWRVLISMILIPALLALFWLDAGQGPAAPYLFGLCLLMTVRSSFELTQLLTVRTMRPSFAVSAGCSLLVIVAAWIPAWAGDAGTSAGSLLTGLGWIAAAIILSFCVLLIREAAVYAEPGRSMESLGANLVTVIYGGVLLAVIAQFRWFPDHRLAYFAIGSMVIAVKSGDIGAYTFGRLWGRRKMAPRLSPGKTWMGFVGALVGSILGGGLWLSLGGRLFEGHPVPTCWLTVIGYSACLGIVGLIGDLVESLLKRDVGKKDSAPLLPGFGGLLDILDSPLFAGPFALAWWHLLPPAGF